MIVSNNIKSNQRRTQSLNTQTSNNKKKQNNTPEPNIYQHQLRLQSLKMQMEWFYIEHLARAKMSEWKARARTHAFCKWIEAKTMEQYDHIEIQLLYTTNSTDKCRLYSNIKMLNQYSKSYTSPVTILFGTVHTKKPTCTNANNNNNNGSNVERDQ